MLHQDMEHIFNRYPAQYITHTSSAVSESVPALYTRHKLA